MLDGDDLFFTTWRTTVKAANLRRGPRLALAVDDETPPHADVVSEGTATISKDLQELRAWATRIGERDMGADEAEALGTRNGVPGELLVRVTPVRITARAARAG